MGLLVNLELLHLTTKQFTPKDLRVLGGMPALETLSLYFPDSHAGPFTVGGRELFQHLKSFRVGRLYQPMFMPGSMPTLKHLDVRLAFSTTNCFNDLGIQHLASLTRVKLYISASPGHRGVVQYLGTKIRSLLDTSHPNHPTLIFNTLSDHDFYSIEGGNNEVV
jgi:hypothetical protein